MLNLFKTIAQKNYCSSNNVCSVHPSVSALFEILLDEIREISYYLVKLKEFGLTNKKTMELCIQTLSIFMLNTNFNQNNYLKLLHTLIEEKNKSKEKYINYCSSNNIPKETINGNFIVNKNTSINELIKLSENNIAFRQKNLDKTKLRLFELIKLISRLSSISILKIKKYDKTFDIYDFEILRLIALTNSYAIRNEKIIRRVKEFSVILLKIKEKLLKTYEAKYGAKESANIKTTALKGHCILVSGSDLDELEKLLKYIQQQNADLNIYTHGDMLLAHFYPYFKKNKYLKGHLDSDNVEFDFSNFPGPILITQNFIQKIDSLYRGEIFSNKIISFDKVYDIKNENYSQLTESALKMNGFKDDIKDKFINYSYNIDKISKLKNNQEHIIIVSNNNNIQNSTNIDEEVININCPCETDILYSILRNLKEDKIKITLFFSICTIESIGAIFSLLNQNIEIYLADCSHFLINPHVIEALKNDFKINLV